MKRILLEVVSSWFGGGVKRIIFVVVSSWFGGGVRRMLLVVVEVGFVGVRRREALLAEFKLLGTGVVVGVKRKRAVVVVAGEKMLVVVGVNLILGVTVVVVGVDVDDETVGVVRMGVCRSVVTSIGFGVGVCRSVVVGVCRMFCGIVDGGSGVMRRVIVDVAVDENGSGVLLISGTLLIFTGGCSVCLVTPTEVVFVIIDGVLPLTRCSTRAGATVVVGGIVLFRFLSPPGGSTSTALVVDRVV